MTNALQAQLTAQASGMAQAEAKGTAQQLLSANLTPQQQQNVQLLTGLWEKSQTAAGRKDIAISISAQVTDSTLGPPGGAVVNAVLSGKFGTSKSNIRQYAQIAGGAAAAGGCTAIGAGAAAPLCATVGSYISGVVFDGISDLLGSSGPSKKTYRKWDGERNERQLDAANKVDATIAALRNYWSTLAPSAPSLTADDIVDMLLKADKKLFATPSDPPLIVKDYRWSNFPGSMKWKDVNAACHQGRCGALVWTAPWISSRYHEGADTSKQTQYKFSRAPLDYDWGVSSDNASKRMNTVRELWKQWDERLSMAALQVSGAMVNIAAQLRLGALLQSAKKSIQVGAQYNLSAQQQLQLTTQMLIEDQQAIKKAAEWRRTEVEARRQESQAVSGQLRRSVARERWMLVGSVAALSTLAAWLWRKR